MSIVSGLDAGSFTDAASFSSVRKPIDRADPMQQSSQKLLEINAKLAEVRRLRLQAMDSSKNSGDQSSSSNSQSAAPHHRKKVEKKAKVVRSNTNLHHPKLDFVVGEVVFSPYMTKPHMPYPDAVFRIPEKLRELKKRNEKLKDLPIEEQPYDLQLAHEVFVNEVIRYNGSFLQDKKIKKHLSSSADSAMFSSVSPSSGSIASHSRSSYSLPQLKGARSPSSTSLRKNLLKSTPSSGNVKESTFASSTPGVAVSSPAPRRASDPTSSVSKKQDSAVAQSSSSTISDSAHVSEKDTTTRTSAAASDEVTDSSSIPETSFLTEHEISLLFHSLAAITQLS